MNNYYKRKAVNMLKDYQPVYLLKKEDNLLYRLDSEYIFVEKYFHVCHGVDFSRYFISSSLCFIKDEPDVIYTIEELNWRGTYSSSYQSLKHIDDLDIEFVKEKDVAQLVNSVSMLRELKK